MDNETNLSHRATGRRHKQAERRRGQSAAERMFETESPAELEKTTSPPTKESLKNEVLNEIEKEELKKEMLKEIEGGTYYIKKIGQHPLILLVIGFILTSILGTWLVNNWQSREWDRQQARQVQQKEIDQKYALIDEVTKTITEHETATLHVLETLSWESESEYFKDERTLRFKEWRLKSTDWSNKSRQLQSKLYVYFKNPEIHLTFEAIMIERNQIDKDTAELWTDMGSSKDTTKERGNGSGMGWAETAQAKRRERGYKIKDSLDKSVIHLRRLVDLIISDISTEKQRIQ